MDPAAAAHPGYTKRFIVGHRVEGVPRDAEGRVHAGTVTAVHGDGTISVAFITLKSSVGTSIVVEEAAMEPLVSPADGVPISELRPGLPVNARYSVDRQWYAAKVDSVPGPGVVSLTYTDYGNSETLPVEYLRRRTEAGAGAATGAAGAGGAGGTVAASNLLAAAAAAEDGDDGIEPGKGIYTGLVIPESMRILPTDTEAERIRKKKRVSSLKLTWKHKQLDASASSRASSWQAFSSKKKLPGVAATSSSIFRTSDKK